MREAVLPAISISLGNRKTARLWWDPWDDNQSPTSHGFAVHQLQLQLGNPFIADLWQNNGWAFPHNENEEATTIFNKLAGLVLETDVDDVYLWNLTPNLNYSLKTAWNEIRNREDVKPWAKLIWNDVVAPSRAWYCWRALHNRLPTIDRLHKLDMQIVNTCPLCNRALESVNHLFFCCPYSVGIWTKCSKTLGWKPHGAPDLGLILAELAVGFQHNVCQLAACILVSEAVYYIWEERNRRIHNEGELELSQIWQKSRPMPLTK